MALEFVVRNVLNLVDAYSVRIGRSVVRLTQQGEAEYAMILWWKRHPEDG